MSKLFNWFFGSFFRTAGRFLFYILLFLLLSFIIYSRNANAQEVADDWMTGSVWDGSTIVKTFDNSLTPQYLGYTNSLYGQVIKVYLGLTKHSYDPLILNNSIKKSWFYNVEICSTVSIPTTYTIAYSGRGQVITAYDMQIGGTCTLGGSLTGKLYTVPIAVKFNSYELDEESTERVSSIVIDVTGGINYEGNGKYAVTNISVQEYTEEIISAYKQQAQNNTIINQNSTIINQNEQIINKQEQTNQKLDGINNSLTSTEGADLGALQNSAGWLPTGPVDSILNLPLSLLNNLTTNLNKSCSPLVVPIPFVNKNLTIPCLNTIYESIDGLNVWITTISIIASGFILYSYFLKLYKWVEDTLMFNDSNGLSSWGGV